MTDVLGRLDALPLAPVRVWYEALDEAWPKLRAIVLAAEEYFKDTAYDEYRGCRYGWCAGCGVALSGSMTQNDFASIEHEKDCSALVLSRALNALRAEVPK